MESVYVQFEGTLVNEEELRREHQLEEGNLISALYQRYGVELVKYLRGEFVFSVVDKLKENIYLFRDRIGVRTIYYTTVNGLLVYSSSLGKILQYPGVKAILDREGACEILGMGPAHTPGHTPFKGIFELLPGSFLVYGSRGIQIHSYWKLETKEHKESLEDTIEKCSELFEGALLAGAKGKAPGFMLSGGLDSSYVAAVWNRIGKEPSSQKPIDTYSLDFPNSENTFIANPYQPDLDRPYVDIMVKQLASNHTYVYCSVEHQVEDLERAMMSHGMPCMVDIQSTLDYFCGEIGKRHSVIATGECADEIFGGYPWFHVPELMSYEGFIWAKNMEVRSVLLNDEVNKRLTITEYVRARYQEAIREIDYLDEEDEEERMLRRNAYLTIQYFMSTLIRRTMVAGKLNNVEALVPFANPELVEYAYNIPWRMKKKEGKRKYILKQMAKEYLPEAIIGRAKSPYPKNFDPTYQRIMKQWWEDEWKKELPIFALVDKNKLKAALENESDFANPWFGQLMRKPQLIAYYWQLNKWLVNYNVDVDLK